jgi:asparagine synthase (glutamine-hydrolysing)
MGENPVDPVVPLARCLAEAAARIAPSSEEVTVLYSGGLDSSVVAWLVRAHPQLELLTVGRPEAPDLDAGRSGAERLGLPWREVVLDDERFRSGTRTWSPQLAGLREPQRSVLLALALAFDECRSRTALLGQGADELFGGYAHFRGLDPASAVARSAADYHQLVERDWPATRALALERQIDVHSPFLDPAVVAIVQALPVERRGFGSERKELLRRVARHLGVPDALIDRPKRAMQYGTRIARDLPRFLSSDARGAGTQSASPRPPEARG